MGVGLVLLAFLTRAGLPLMKANIVKVLVTLAVTVTALPVFIIQGKGEVVAGDHLNDRAFTWWLGRSPHSRERRGAGNTNLHDCRCNRVNRQATWSLRMMRERYWSTDGTCGRI